MLMPTALAAEMIPCDGRPRMAGQGAALLLLVTLAKMRRAVGLVISPRYHVHDR